MTADDVNEALKSRAMVQKRGECGDGVVKAEYHRDCFDELQRPQNRSKRFGKQLRRLVVLENYEQHVDLTEIDGVVDGELWKDRVDDEVVADWQRVNQRGKYLQIR